MPSPLVFIEVFLAWALAVLVVINGDAAAEIHIVKRANAVAVDGLDQESASAARNTMAQRRVYARANFSAKLSVPRRR
jgi:hypothetical protein